MLRLKLAQDSSKALTILCLGAHCDDIEIGCGGTLLQLKSRYSQIKFHWVVFSASGPRGGEATKAAQLFTSGCETQIVLKGFRDGFLPYTGAEVKGFFEELKISVNPDVIFTHWGNDAHQDHRLISELTWNTYRNHMILEYEIPKYDGDLGRPNLFMSLEPDAYQNKIRYIMDAFQSQRSKHWFQEDTFLSLMRLRGMECNSPSNYAEAFHCRKLALQS
jgi:LmbE family N-acetylglucosaminyl deacetylase